MSKDIFISHAWGIDENNNDNHERCKKICNILKKNGYSVWFDDYEMFGNIDKNIIKGINSCKVVLICLTEKYINKINNSIFLDRPNDNCFKEWNYAIFKNKKLIQLIMEEKAKNIYLNNDGVIQMYLNNCMFIDFSNINNIMSYASLYKTLNEYNLYKKNHVQILRTLNTSNKFINKNLPNIFIKNHSNIVTQIKI